MFRRNLFNNRVFLLALAVFAASLCGCVSTKGERMSMTDDEKQSYEILGTVAKDMEVNHLFNNEERLENQAYILLLKEAQKTYDGNIDVRNIKFVPKTQWIVFNSEKYTVYGKVIRLKEVL